MSFTDINEIARTEINKALSKYFLGYEYDDGRTGEEHLSSATNDVLNNISRLLQTRPASSRKLGATVMTETASMMNGKNGKPGIPPRSL